jgi:demethylmenaquinone methyltransferase/2-methoxy-6-polyprenyl-1,4-benzoquinol methylase
MPVTGSPASQPSAKPRPLKRMFDAVPRRYDLLNRILTLRFDEAWRALAARRIFENSPARVLDLCCGTGDLINHMARRAPSGVALSALDFSPGMLELARKKLAGREVEFIEGDAAAMPFDSGSFGAVGTAFAFRNLTWKNPLRDAALAEVLRVLKPGGRFVIVETSQPRNGLWRWIFHTYLRLFAGPVGSALSGHPEAYRYLALSARNFYRADDVCTMLRAAGFSTVDACPLLGGIAALHVAIK